MNSLAVITFSGWNWLLPACGFLAASVLILLWSYLAAPRGGLRWACLGLKAAALAALALCLLEPLWFGEHVRPGANLFALMADNSQSMQIKDSGATQTRGEGMVKLLDPASPWLSTLGDSFDVRRYVFDARFQATTDFRELVFDGRSTALAGALRTLGDRFKGRPLAGVILLTDGNATDIGDTPPDLSKLPPIYPVVIGSQVPVKDIALQQVSATQSAFEDAPVSVQADVTAAGFSGQPIVARLTDDKGKTVQEQTLTGKGDGDALAYRFQLKPERSGLLFYKVTVGAQQIAQSGAAPAATEEATLANNSRVIVVNRGGGPYRVLYVSGHPGWEYKFINRAVQEDKQVELVGLRQQVAQLTVAHRAAVLEARREQQREHVRARHRAAAPRGDVGQQQLVDLGDQRREALERRGASEPARGQHAEADRDRGGAVEQLRQQDAQA